VVLGHRDILTCISRGRGVSVIERAVLRGAGERERGLGLYLYDWEWDK
jgi:hypothetical protein